MPKNKDSIALPKELAKAIAKEAADRDMFQYEVVAEAWTAYKKAAGQFRPPPPDQHAAILSKARTILDHSPEAKEHLSATIEGVFRLLKRGAF